MAKRHRNTTHELRTPGGKRLGSKRRPGHSELSPSGANRRKQSRTAHSKTSFDRYIVLARAAATAGDTIEAENYYQHAEHFFRLMREPAASH